MQDPCSSPDKSTLAPGLKLLPDDIREDVYRLYHVLRSLDDLVDEDQPQAEQRVTAVEQWAQGATTDSPETRVLQEISLRHTLPPDAILEFCQGMRHDIARRTIYTEDDLELYCQRAGGTVGIMLVHLLGSTHPTAAAQMATLGRAVQRTNILRDIDDDAAHGRLYISQEAIDRFGALTGTRHNLIRDQIARADVLYGQAAQATSMLARGRRGMALCAHLYHQILRQIERDLDGHSLMQHEQPQPEQLRVIDNRSSRIPY
jgi:phytoene synthase